MYRLNKAIEVEDIDEGKCLINEVNETIILLRKVEKEIFELLLNNSLDYVKEIILNKYEGKDIVRDIDVFVQRLCDKEILYME